MSDFLFRSFCVLVRCLGFVHITLRVVFTVGLVLGGSSRSVCLLVAVGDFIRYCVLSLLRNHWLHILKGR